MITRLPYITLTTAFILLIPLVAMQFTNQVAWTVSDFVAAGVLLFGASCTLTLLFDKAGKYRAAGTVVVVLVFIYIWAELAVGIFTNWGS
jgi:hypothetical protein